MAVHIEIDGLGDAAGQLAEDADAYEVAVQEWFGHRLVAALRSVALSLVNVDTGRMRASFWWDRAAGLLRISNSARNPRNQFRYPLWIEEHYRGAARTLAAQGSKIAAAAQLAASEGRKVTRIYRRRVS